ncbi:anti-sigma factor antagonist [Candidatus Marinimicrobia bacterium MT.SAG.3]|nr:anti-sigma factor antagonist [Candidatus Marinimicrobia bacterium MT.SAG.3]
MKYSHDQVGDTLIFRIEEHRLHTALSVEVKEKLDELLQNKEVKNLLFNLSMVKSIDSSGLSSLLFGRRLIADREGKCLIINPQPKVTSLMRIARLDTVFIIHDDEGSALKSL